MADGRAVSAAGRRVAGADGRRADALSRSAVVARAAGAARRGASPPGGCPGSRSRRLSQLAAAARQIDVTTLDRRLPVRGVGDELDRVARRLQRDARPARACGRGDAPVQRRAGARAADAAGRASRRDRAGAARAGARARARGTGVASQIEEIDQLTRLIDQILTLARAESGQIRLTHGAGRSRRARRVARRSARTDRGGAGDRRCAARRRSGGRRRATPAGSSGCC